MGKASRNRARKSRKQAEQEWSAELYGKRCVDLTEHLKKPHPAQLGFALASLRQYCDRVQQLDLTDSQREELYLRIGFRAEQLGMSGTQWRDRVMALVRRMQDRATAGQWRDTLDELSVLTPHGQPLPAHAESYVLSPEMHNVVAAAALTITEDDLKTLSIVDPPTPAGLLYLPRQMGGATASDQVRHHSPFVAISWIPVVSSMIADGVAKPGVFCQWWAQRTALQGGPAWNATVQISRTVDWPTPLALPVGDTRLWDYGQLTEEESLRLDESEKFSEEFNYGDAAGEYIPDDDVPIDVSSYIFSFWRLCGQKITQVVDAQGAERPRSGAASADTGPLDRLRVVRLRSHRIAGTGDLAESRYNHRWPVRIHKVRQYYPSLDAQKVIFRGPYVKGPSGAPLLVGGKVLMP